MKSISACCQKWSARPSGGSSNRTSGSHRVGWPFNLPGKFLVGRCTGGLLATWNESHVPVLQGATWLVPYSGNIGPVSVHQLPHPASCLVGVEEGNEWNNAHHWYPWLVWPELPLQCWLLRLLWAFSLFAYGPFQLVSSRLNDTYCH